MTDITHPTHAERQDVTPRSGAAPVLWILLVVALLALAWWMATQRSGSLPNDVAIAPTTTAPAASATPAPRAAASRTHAPARARGATASAAAVAGSRNAALLAHAKPRYPVAALRGGIEGTVTLRIAVDANGVPTDIGYAKRSGDQALDRAAMQAARDWRFRPAQRDGRAVASTVNVPVRFTLPDSSRG